MTRFELPRILNRKSVAEAIEENEAEDEPDVLKTKENERDGRNDRTGNISGRAHHPKEAYGVVVTAVNVLEEVAFRHNLYETRSNAYCKENGCPKNKVIGINKT